MKDSQNLVGPQVRRLRNQRGWSQDQLAAQLNLTGWDISRATLSKIEAQLRCVTDGELLYLARALKVDMAALIPADVARRFLRN